LIPTDGASGNDEMRPRRHRVIVAFAVAPAIAPLVVFVILALVSPSGAVFPAAIAAATSYTTAFTFGLAGHLLLVRIGRTGGLWYSGAGFAIAVTLAAYVFIVMGESGEHVAFALRHETLRTLLLPAGFGVLGGLNGLVFWAILRPDRKAGT
jgi:hypothetical protein